jgi:hypothetical protein
MQTREGGASHDEERGRSQMRKRLTVLTGVVVLLFPVGGTALAANPGTTGQPSQSCEDQPLSPGNAAGAPGSAFNPDGKAGTVYAGEQPQNSNNPSSVSQYDVACFQVSQH